MRNGRNGPSIYVAFPCSVCLCIFCFRRLRAEFCEWLFLLIEGDNTDEDEVQLEDDGEKIGDEDELAFLNELGN